MRQLRITHSSWIRIRPPGWCQASPRSSIKEECDLHFASIKNAAGLFINPSIRNVAAAAAAVKSVPANGELHIVNPSKTNRNAYPISTFTYVIVPHQSSNGAALRKMIFWALTQGQAAKYTAKLWFAPIPKPVLVYSEKAINTINAA